MSKEVEEAGGKIAEDVKPVIPDDDDKAADIPEGFSSDEWNDLSDEEREGLAVRGDGGAVGVFVALVFEELDGKLFYCVFCYNSPHFFQLPNFNYNQPSLHRSSAWAKGYPVVSQGYEFA